MSHVEAIFQQGVFRPLEAVDLAENERVVLSYQSARAPDFMSWLETTRTHREEMLRRRGSSGPLPDSTPLIREDRDR
jgi:predicted DNA-binding antitoxin AbrB/MazE fold protein